MKSPTAASSVPMGEKGSSPKWCPFRENETTHPFTNSPGLYRVQQATDPWEREIMKTRGKVLHRILSRVLPLIPSMQIYLPISYCIMEPSLCKNKEALCCLAVREKSECTLGGSNVLYPPPEGHTAAEAPSSSMQTEQHTAGRTNSGWWTFGSSAS